MSWLPYTAEIASAMHLSTAAESAGGGDGRIVADEEHPLGARITLRANGHVAPWSIRCEIYGMLVHKMFCRDVTAPLSMYREMKAYIDELLGSGCHTDREEQNRIVDQFVRRFL